MNNLKHNALVDFPILKAPSQVDLFTKRDEMCAVEELCRRYVTPSRNQIRQAINSGKLPAVGISNDRVVRLSDFKSIFTNAELAPQHVELDIDELLPIFAVSRYLSISSDGLRRAIRRGILPSIGNSPTTVKIRDILDAYPRMTTRSHVNVTFYSSHLDDIPTANNVAPIDSISPSESFSSNVETVSQQTSDTVLRESIKSLESIVCEQRNQINQLLDMLNDNPSIKAPTPVPVKTKKRWLPWK